MHSKAVLPALGALVTAVASQSTTCHDYVIISTRGTFELQGPSIAFKGMINNTLAAIPNGVEYDTVYPAAANQTSYLGADDIVRFIDSGLKSCPKQKYALLGYSQGAVATEQALYNYTDPSSAGYKAIRAILVVGDPAHKPNASVNVDQFGGDSTSSYAGVEYNADNMPNPFPPVFYNNGNLLDICFQEDAICAPHYPNATFVPGHLHYGEEIIQTMGTKFLLSKLGGSGNGTSTNSTSTTPSSNSTAPTNATSTGGSRPSGTGRVGGGSPSSTAYVSGSSQVPATAVTALLMAGAAFAIASMGY